MGNGGGERSVGEPTERLLQCVLIAADLVEDSLPEDHADMDVPGHVGQKLGDQVVGGVGCVAGNDAGGSG